MMGTREVYEEKLRTGNLHHDPTLKPGLGTPRCPRCLFPIDSHFGDGDWTITPVLHDTTAVAGSGLGALLSTIYGFNSGIMQGYHTLKDMLRDQSGVSFWLGLSSPKVYTTYCDIIFCCLECFTLWDLTAN